MGVLLGVRFRVAAGGITDGDNTKDQNGPSRKILNA